MTTIIRKILLALQVAFLSLILSAASTKSASSVLGQGGEQHHRRLDLTVLSRSLQETSQHQELPIPPCNTLLGSLTADELRDTVSTVIDTIAPDPESSERTYLRAILLQPIQYGIQVHRLCAGCQDVAAEVPADSKDVFDTFCGPDNYGAVNATFSGLMIVPTTTNGEADGDTRILNGTLKGIIDMHPTAISLVPSLMWSIFEDRDEDGSNEESLLLQLNGIVASTGQALIFPDYMGYAENADELFKGYTIKKAYETSCVPIVFWARQYIRQLTNCATAISTTVGLKGYSEGGLSALVLADVLHRLGWNIVAVHVGGGPFKMGAETITKTFERVTQGRYDMYFRHIFGLVGTAYSSTYRDLPNYERGQDMLTSEIRPVLVDLITKSTPEPLVKEYLPYENPTDILYLLFDAEYLEFVNASVSRGSYDPCSDTPEEELKERNLHLICESFRMNDVSEMLQSAPYQVDVCHSPDDEVVPFESVPDLGGNDNLSLNVVSGSHNEAGAQCIFSSLIYFLSLGFKSVAVQNEHSMAGCSSISDNAPETAMDDPSSSEMPPENEGTDQQDIQPENSGGQRSMTLDWTVLWAQLKVFAVMVSFFVF